MQQLPINADRRIYDFHMLPFSIFQTRRNSYKGINYFG